MSLTYGLQTAKELLEKLRRDAALLDEEVSSDRFFNFVVTGYSLIDWIKNDPAVPAAAKAAVSPLYSDPWLKVCGDLATASKHFILTTRVPMLLTLVPFADGVPAASERAAGAWAKNQLR